MNYYTEDLADFGYRERDELLDILKAWQDHGLPEGFDGDRVRCGFNMNSGYVFLVNEEGQTAMVTDDGTGLRLEIWHTLPYCGEEGFLSELLELPADQLNADDIEYLQHYEPSYGTKEEA